MQFLPAITGNGTHIIYKNGDFGSPSRVVFQFGIAKLVNILQFHYGL